MGALTMPSGDILGYLLSTLTGAGRGADDLMQRDRQRSQDLLSQQDAIQRRRLMDAQIAQAQAKPTRRAVGTEQVMGPDGKPRLAVRYEDGGIEATEQQPYMKPEAPKSWVPTTRQEALDFAREKARIDAQFRPPPAPPSPTIIPTSNGYLSVDKTTNTTRPIMDPSGNPVMRPMTGGIAEKVVGNQQTIDAIDRALAAIDRHPDAVGAKRGWFDFIDQRADPEGVNARADIADIGSLKIHERSGAAVTVSEAPRLQPFVPNVKDTPDAIRRKLKLLRAKALHENQAMAPGWKPGQQVAPAPEGADIGPNLERF